MQDRPVVQLILMIMTNAKKSRSLANVTSLPKITVKTSILAPAAPSPSINVPIIGVNTGVILTIQYFQVL